MPASVMGMRASGRPTNSTAWAGAVATTRAMGSAIPTSSAACETIRRALKGGAARRPVQGDPRVPVGDVHQMAQGVVVHRDRLAAEPPRVGERTLQDRPQVFFPERLQLQHARAGDEGGIDLEERI